MAAEPIALADVRSEIEAVHVFLEEWITGSCEGDEAVLQARFCARLAPDFRYVTPGGSVLQGAQVEGAIRGMYGKNPELRIAIAEVALAYADERAALATYQERQRGARNVQPPSHARVSSVLLLWEGGRLVWKHLQETLRPAPGAA